jgi:hypothetical protein
MDYTVRLDDQPWLVDEPFSMQFEDLPRFLQWVITHLDTQEMVDLCNSVPMSGEVSIELKLNGVPVNFPRFAQRIQKAVEAQIAQELMGATKMLAKKNATMFKIWDAQKALQNALDVLVS